MVKLKDLFAWQKGMFIGLSIDIVLIILRYVFYVLFASSPLSWILSPFRWIQNVLSFVIIFFGLGRYLPFTTYCTVIGVVIDVLKKRENRGLGILSLVLGVWSGISLIRQLLSVMLGLGSEYKLYWVFLFPLTLSIFLIIKGIKIIKSSKTQ